MIWIAVLPLGFCEYAAAKLKVKAPRILDGTLFHLPFIAFDLEQTEEKCNTEDILFNMPKCPRPLTLRTDSKQRIFCAIELAHDR